MVFAFTPWIPYLLTQLPPGHLGLLIVQFYHHQLSDAFLAGAQKGMRADPHKPSNWRFPLRGPLGPFPHSILNIYKFFAVESHAGNIVLKAMRLLVCLGAWRFAARTRCPNPPTRPSAAQIQTTTFLKMSQFKRLKTRKEHVFIFISF